MSENEDVPVAPARSDVDEEVEMVRDGGTLVWRDPVASENSVPGAYLWPCIILFILFMTMLTVFP